MFLAETCDALVIRDQWTCKLDGCGDQQAIRGVALLQMAELIAAGCRIQSQWHGLYAGALEETLDPSLNRKIEINPLGVNEERNLPGCDGTYENGSSVSPASVDQGTGGGAQSPVAAVEPESDMGIKQKRIRYRLLSRPVSASGWTSSAGASRSTPS